MKNLKKFLGLFLVVLALVFCVPSSVSAEEVMSEEFKSYLNEDLELEVKGSVPKDLINFLVRMVFVMYDNDFDYNSFTFGDYSDDYSEIELIINYEKANEEKHRVKLKYIYDELTETKINELLSDDEKAKDTFILSDLDMIHHYYNRHKYEIIRDSYNEYFKLYSVSSEVKSVLDNKNVEFQMLTLIDEDESGLKGQKLTGIGWYFYNDGIYYAYDKAMYLNANHVLYVPSDTENNVDAIKNAGQKRINDYLKTDDVKLTYVSTARDYLLNNSSITTYENFEEVFEEQFEIKGISENDHVYNVKMDIDSDISNSFDIIIKRDSSKMVLPNLKTIDLLTGVGVSTNSNVQLDALIEIRQLTTGAEYEKIARLLNLTDSITFDIKLYSKSLKNYISKLEDGLFEVKIPIPDKLKGKDLTAYYVTENGKIEKYNVTVKDGYAIFKTTHFSIYTLGYRDKNSSSEKENNSNSSTNKPSNKVTPAGNKIEKVNNKKNNVTNGVENPQTSDDLLLYVSVGIISLISSSVIGVYVFRKNRLIKTV